MHAAPAAPVTVSGQPGIALPGGRTVRTAHADADDLDAAFGQLQARLGPGPFSLLLLFVAAGADRAGVAQRADAILPGTPVIGCTTAGEIAATGYASDQIVAIGLPTATFTVETQFIGALDRLDRLAIAGDTGRHRVALARRAPGRPHEFALLLVDGLSLLEDRLVAALSPALGDTPLFGGSAGDGLDFRHSFVLHGGAFHENAAVLALVRTICPIQVFRFDHLQPTGRKMVVTGADPAHRVVTEINAEPAAREYARIVGLDPERLSPFVFAAHPVVVRLGDRHHVRAIQQVLPTGDLRFFSAIDEGLVLTVAEPRNMADHLAEALAGLQAHGQPDAIIAFDCILRRLDAERNQSIGALSRTLAANRVVGFSTYGEQINAVHVNQTLTGIALYPPVELAAE